MYRRLIKRRNNALLQITIFAMIMFPASKIFAQQEPHFTQYMFNRLSYNPAYAGSNGAMCLTAFYRDQWMGMKIYDPQTGESSSEALRTINATFDMPVKFLHGGIGATFIQDQIGHWNNMYIKVDYVYRVQLPKGTLSFGLEAQIFNGQFDKDKLVGADDRNSQDEIVSSSDPLLQNAAQTSDMLFDLGFGAYYLVPGKFYAGFSASKLLESKSDKLSWRNNRYYYFIAGYEWVLPSYPSLKVMPSALFKHDFASSDSWQIYGSVLVEYENKVWGGIGARMDDAISILAGFNVSTFKIGVSYDIPTSRLSNAGKGSLELMLRYCFKVENPPKPNTIYGNTRY
ncbi:MAG: type IX secretion system membrane protein PorP/SprF [Bacteroidales bacterium]|jgi:type IX secretion system PorP/SprF family membrane protein|nr:type IX secretion system membrane protein PorP/SprF [Bacteroidales bacterium]